jgi:anti-anti-sigma factor
MEVVVNPRSNSLKISGVLDINGACHLRDSLLHHAINNEHLSLDLGGVDLCDTAGIQVLIATRLYAESLSKKFGLTAVSEPVLKVAKALGVDLGEIHHS